MNLHGTPLTALSFPTNRLLMQVHYALRIRHRVCYIAEQRSARSERHVLHCILAARDETRFPLFDTFTEQIFKVPLRGQFFIVLSPFLFIYLSPSFSLYLAFSQPCMLKCLDTLSHGSDHFALPVSNCSWAVLEMR